MPTSHERCRSCIHCDVMSYNFDYCVYRSVPLHQIPEELIASCEEYDEFKALAVVKAETNQETWEMAGECSEDSSLDGESVILPESNEAAQYRTLTGWVDRHGRYWAEEERLARWSGATHIRCDTCGGVIKKHGYTICDACREKIDVAAYNRYPTKPYEGGWCYSEACERYFEDEDDIYEFMTEEDLTWEDLRVCSVVPNHLFPIDSDCWEDVFPDEGGNLPPEVEDALESLNFAIENALPMSYSPGKIALTLNP